MTATVFSLLAVVIAFTALVVWVYSPSRRRRLEKYGSIPLDDDDPAPQTPGDETRREGDAARREEDTDSGDGNPR